MVTTTPTCHIISNDYNNNNNNRYLTSEKDTCNDEYCRAKNPSLLLLTFWLLMTCFWRPHNLQYWTYLIIDHDLSSFSHDCSMYCSIFVLLFVLVGGGAASTSNRPYQQQSSPSWFRCFSSRRIEQKRSKRDERTRFDGGWCRKYTLGNVGNV